MSASSIACDSVDIQGGYSWWDGSATRSVAFNAPLPDNALLTATGSFASFATATPAPRRAALRGARAGKL